MRQVSRRGQGRGRGWAGTVDRGGEVSQGRIDRLGLVSVRQDFVGFQPTTFALVDGRVVTGIVGNETAAVVEIQDSDAKLVRLAKDQIDERKRSNISLMPTGLAKGLSPQDFVDLIEYLETLKNAK